MGMIKIPTIFNSLISKAKSLVMEELSPDLTDGQTVSESTPDQSPEVTESTPESNPSPVKKLTFINGLTAVFNGLGVGILLGMLLGMSISPLVSGVVATLSSLLVVLLGLNEKYQDPVKSLRIGSFGVFAVAGILFGVYIRANNPLSPSLLEQKNEYVAVGYNEEEAKAMITKSIEADSTKAKRQTNLLFSGTFKITDCKELSEIEEDWSSGEIVQNFIAVGGNWKEFAVTFKADLQDDDIRKKSLLAMRDCICGSGASGEIKMTNLEEISGLGTNNSVEQIEKVLSSPASGSASGVNWNTIVKAVQERIPAEKRKDVYLAIIKVLGHD